MNEVEANGSNGSIQVPSAWRPRGLVSSLIDAVYQLTEPPLRWLRQYIRPIPLGPIYFDVAFIVLYFILIAIDFLI